MPISSFSTRILTNADDGWSAAIADLDASGLPVPVTARKEWPSRSGRRLLVVADDAQGKVRAAIALEVEPTLALPGHYLARAYRLGGAVAEPAGVATLERLREYAAGTSRLLRVNLEFILLAADDRVRVESLLSTNGFRRTSSPRSYTNTFVLDLNCSSSEITKSFSEQARRNLYVTDRAPVEMRPIFESRYADRLNVVATQSFVRTGGRYERKDWIARIDFHRRFPDRCHLVGLFRRGDPRPDGLLAFAFGCSHGDHAHYDDAGSVRVGDIKISMMYPLVWELIRWSKQVGCKWFDLGGIPLQYRRPDDPRAGITEFKSRFSKVAVPVGIEWEFQPHRVRAGIAAAVRSAAEIFGVTSRVSASR